MDPRLIHPIRIEDMRGLEARPAFVVNTRRRLVSVRIGFLDCGLRLICLSFLLIGMMPFLIAQTTNPAPTDFAILPVKQVSPQFHTLRLKGTTLSR